LSNGTTRKGTAFYSKVAKPGFQVLFWLIVLGYQFAAYDSLKNWQLSRAAWDYLGRMAKRAEASPGEFRAEVAADVRRL
jgi:hypothetical protein